jgi:hypothetical protein
MNVGSLSRVAGKPVTLTAIKPSGTIGFNSSGPELSHTYKWIEWPFIPEPIEPIFTAKKKKYRSLDDPWEPE